jgi:hypothetical protein
MLEMMVASYGEDFAVVFDILQLGGITASEVFERFRRDGHIALSLKEIISLTSRSIPISNNAVHRSDDIQIQGT